ncbi:hypothetical protein SEPCBS119000_000224 [Sporothrix epigloea]|uniref:FAS1 domain-containing protein n=1 Tax=Sporothrix epigloea TaxID=1892477 RepID=A0ABP0D4B9_9PEZI
MKLTFAPAIVSLSLVAGFRFIVPQHAPASRQPIAVGAGSNHQDQQRPLAMPQPPPPAGPAVPVRPDDGSGATSPPPESGAIFLSDVMGRDRTINVFAGFTRDFAPITNRFDDATQNSTVLAPLNSAIEALPRKPWEDPQDYHTLGADVYEGSDGQERAQQNLQRFVEAHIVPVSPWPEKLKASAMAGAGELWWEWRDGKRVLQPGNIEVISVASTVANGQIWIIKGVRNYAS